MTETEVKIINGRSVCDTTARDAAAKNTEAITAMQENNGQNVELDATLTKSGKAADAKAVGDKFKKYVQTINGAKPDPETGDAVVDATIINQNCGEVLKIWAGTLDEFNAILVKDESTIYLIEGVATSVVSLIGIEVEYTGGNVLVGTTVDELPGVSVRAIYNSGALETVQGYTLSGEIVEGDNTITVTYANMETTFIVTAVTDVADLGVIASATQGNASTGSADTDKITIILKPVTIPAGRSIAIKAKSGFSIYLFKILGTTDKSLAGTIESQNVTYAYVQDESGDVYNGKTPGSLITANGYDFCVYAHAISWTTDAITLLNTNETESVTINGIGLMAKRTNNSIIVPAEAPYTFEIT